MTGKIAVITGANRGLGLATATELARRGYSVVMSARQKSDADQAAKPLLAEGLDVHTGELDISSDASVEAFFAWLGERFGRIDVLVNNAGEVFERRDPRTSQVDASLMLKAFNTNALGPWRMMQKALPMMNAQGFGRIVNLTSGMGQLSEMGGGNPAYRVSKTGVNAMTIIMAHEAAPGVKINTVCPGWVRTEMGGPRATRDIDEGIAGIVWAATLEDDGPTGGFFRDGKRLDW
ncbi:MAG: SDR family NAD(P)-dependent oxidoreductase [Bradymonadaceae bacterium]|nr:SDR family NAD(P)-dependent oxidoreductase [Lujinxingiaceae bacterium]